MALESKKSLYSTGYEYINLYLGLETAVDSISSDSFLISSSSSANSSFYYYYFNFSSSLVFSFSSLI